MRLHRPEASTLLFRYTGRSTGIAADPELRSSQQAIGRARGSLDQTRDRGLADGRLRRSRRAKIAMEQLRDECDNLRAEVARHRVQHGC
jgi:hypothetical protein